MSPLVALALNLGDYPVSLPEDPAHPPVKSRLLSNLKWMGLFQAGQLLPRSTAILPFAAQLPPSGGALYNLLAIDDCHLVIPGYSHGRILMVIHDPAGCTDSCPRHTGHRWPER